MDLRNLLNDAPADETVAVKSEPRSARPLSTPTPASRGSWSQMSPPATITNGNGALPPPQSAVFPAAGYPPPTPPARNEPRHSAPVFSAHSSTTSDRPQSRPQSQPQPQYPFPQQQQPRDESVSPKSLPPQPQPLRTPASVSGLKRSAVDFGETPSPKRVRVSRKHTERPIWARLDPRNPRYTTPTSQPTNNNHATVMTPATTKSYKPSSETPVDHNLARMQRILGAWEPSIKNIMPIPSLTKAVADWVHGQLLACEDIGQDAKEGKLEIEAKVGRLYDNSTGLRVALPGSSMHAISPQFFRDKLSFQSEMQENEHKQMNQWLNKTVTESHLIAGRQKIQYEHTCEIDTYEKLSKVGHATLPEAVVKRQTRGDLKLRTTKEWVPKTAKNPHERVGQIKARIIKVKLADLHIYNPQADYDLRITMNVECNLMRPELDPNALVEGEPLPARKKNRMSYRHLNLYQIDLTRVDMEGMEAKYELELEIEPEPLRMQLATLQAGGESGFVDMVQGFIDNATLLMTALPGR